MENMENNTSETQTQTEIQNAFKAYGQSTKTLDRNNTQGAIFFTRESMGM